MAKFVLNDYLPYQLALLASRYSAGFSCSYKEKFGITVPEWRIVAHLSQSEKVSIREIYGKVSMDKSKVSRAAARLQKSGYVSKKTNPTDRRLVELSLTAKGRAMIGEIGPEGMAFEARVLDCLSEDDRRQFLKSINTLLANSDRA